MFAGELVGLCVGVLDSEFVGENVFIVAVIVGVSVPVLHHDIVYSVFNLYILST